MIGIIIFKIAHIYSASTHYRFQQLIHSLVSGTGIKQTDKTIPIGIFVLFH